MNRKVDSPTVLAQSAPLSEEEMQFWKTLPAEQQPDWDSNPLTRRFRGELRQLAPLVDPVDVNRFRSLLAEVTTGRYEVLQAGDCAEALADCTPEHVGNKIALLDALSGAMRTRSTRTVLRVGRIAGQFGKPRSRATEVVNNQTLPVFRGLMINSPEPCPQLRQPDPERLLRCYHAASVAMDRIRQEPVDRWLQPEAAFWTSHEALVLDYELPMVRRTEDGSLVLTSTHWPWIGNRTRQLDGAHIALMAAITNPVACKISADISVDELLTLCERLDPNRQPGRLTLIARMGADAPVGTLLLLVQAVQKAGHPVIWVSDPMHANTIATPSGIKTRTIKAITREIETFHSAIEEAGGVVGGLHLEATPSDVTECVADENSLTDAGQRYTTLCDPRLNPQQAFDVALTWVDHAAQASMRRKK